MTDDWCTVSSLCSKRYVLSYSKTTEMSSISQNLTKLAGMLGIERSIVDGEHVTLLVISASPVCIRGDITGKVANGLENVLECGVMMCRPLYQWQAFGSCIKSDIKRRLRIIKFHNSLSQSNDVLLYSGCYVRKGASRTSTAKLVVGLGDANTMHMIPSMTDTTPGEWEHIADCLPKTLMFNELNMTSSLRLSISETGWKLEGLMPPGSNKRPKVNMNVQLGECTVSIDGDSGRYVWMGSSDVNVAHIVAETVMVYRATR